MSDKVQEGDKVNWSWGGSNPGGTAAEVKAGEVTVVSHRGNEISKTGTEENPAVHIERSGNDVVKTADELNVTKQGPGHNEGSSSKKEETSDKQSNGTSANNKEEHHKDDKRDDKAGDEDIEMEEAKASGEADKKAESKATDKKDSDDQQEADKIPSPQPGEKRKASDQAEDGFKDKDSAKQNGTKDESDDAKKLKKTNGKAAPAPKQDADEDAKEDEDEDDDEKDENDDEEEKDESKKKDGEKKKAGRPKGGANKPKKEKKVPATGQAARKTRSQGAVAEERL